MRAGVLIAGLQLIVLLAMAGCIARAEEMTLNLSRPVLSVPVAELDRSTGDRFVFVDVAEIKNPDAFSLSFKVDYEPTEGEAIYLGSFAPFPADRPGRFIVPTQGLVRDRGRILVSLDLSDQEAVPEILEARIREMKLTDRPPGPAQSP